MTKAQHDAMAYMDSVHANAVRFPSTGWIWRDDIRRREALAEIVLREAAEYANKCQPEIQE